MVFIKSTYYPTESPAGNVHMHQARGNLTIT